MTIPFVLAVAVLVVLTLIWLSRPWWRRRSDNEVSQRELNIAVCREQMTELAADLANGSLDEAAYAEAQRELQRRVLSETEALQASRQKVATGGGRRTLIALVVILPLAAVAGYAWLGNPEANRFQAAADASHGGVGKIDDMVSALAARLEKNPDDPRGWAMLARSYKALGRLEDAEKAFARVGPELEEDAGLLASYADVLAARAEGKIDGRPLQMIEKALQIDPEQPMALSIAGVAAEARGDHQQAIAYWQRLLKVLPPDSEEARSLTAAIDKLRQQKGLPALAVAEAKAKAGKSASPAATAAGAGVQGRVELGKGVKPGSSDVLFLFARPAEGSRMPLAIQRLPASVLPLDFKLDDSMSMAGGTPLSQAGKLIVEARLSRSGDAKPASGDWFGRSGVVEIGAKNLRIVIDTQIP